MSEAKSDVSFLSIQGQEAFGMSMSQHAEHLGYGSSVAWHGGSQLASLRCRNHSAGLHNDMIPTITRIFGSFAFLYIKMTGTCLNAYIVWTFLTRHVRARRRPHRAVVRLARTSVPGIRYQIRTGKRFVSETKQRRVISSILPGRCRVKGRFGLREILRQTLPNFRLNVPAHCNLCPSTYVQLLDRHSVGSDVPQQELLIITRGGGP